MVDEEDFIIMNTHNKILEIFNQVNNELESHEWEEFRNRFFELIKQNFPRCDENKQFTVQRWPFDQTLPVDFIINGIPIKVTSEIYGAGPHIMLEILSHSSCRMGIIINVVEGHNPEFIPIQNPQLAR